MVRLTIVNAGRPRAWTMIRGMETYYRDETLVNITMNKATLRPMSEGLYSIAGLGGVPGREIWLASLYPDQK
jgi:hypothetical protein